jgi:hypothetical protein
LFNHVIFVGSVSTSESMIPRPCFQALHTIYLLFCYMFAHSDTYFILPLLLIIITTTCISLSLRRTSAPIHLTSVLGVLGTQETFCIVIAGLLERDSFDIFLPEFDKPWVIHLRKLAAALQTSALGGPTLSTRTDACVDISSLHFCQATCIPNSTEWMSSTRFWNNYSK